MSEHGKGYDKAILPLELEPAKQHEMEIALLTISDENERSIAVSEASGDIWKDTIEAYHDAEGQHVG